MQKQLCDVKVVRFRGVRVSACEWDRGKPSSGGFLVLVGIGFVVF